MQKKQRKALIIEDSDEHALLLEKYLSHLGDDQPPFLVAKTDTLGKGLDTLSITRFDLILLDLTLPDSDGLDTFKRVYAVAPRVPIIICSGLDDETLALQSIAQGAQDYLIKGEFTEEMFLKIVRYALQRRLAQKQMEEFINMVVHELRSPLMTTIEGLSQMRDGILGDITAEQNEYITLMMKEMKRLTEVVGNLLDVTLIEIDKMELHREVISMVDLVKEINRGLQLRIKSKGLTLTESFSNSNLEISVDKDKIIQVFMNLLSNAIKFTEEGKIEVDVSEKDDCIVCCVSDTGRGIPKDSMHMLFDKYKQFGKRATGGERGSGLGLSIARGIVMAHKGKMWVESKEGEGTQFYFTLPKSTG